MGEAAPLGTGGVGTRLRGGGVLRKERCVCVREVCVRDRCVCV